MNSESELHKSQMTNSASPNTDFLDKKKKTKDNIILVNQKPNEGSGGGTAFKLSNTNANNSILRVKQNNELLFRQKFSKNSLTTSNYQQKQKENINSVNQMIMGPYEKSILRDHQYGFPNNQQNPQSVASTLNFLNSSSLSLAPLFSGQQTSINTLGKKNIVKANSI